jgi:uncharacterized membrane protein
MSELIQNFPDNDFGQRLGTWLNRRFASLSTHWLAMVNTFFFLYVALPLFAPVLLANGYTNGANAIYWVYHLLCHSFPSRTYFIAGEQACLCHRCIAIYATLFIGGVFFHFVRHSLKPLPPKWFLFFMLPMALDGGMGVASELLQFIPIVVLWIIGLATIGLVAVVLYGQKHLTWPVAIFLASGIFALFYLQFFGPHQSNFFLRNLTGFFFGLGTVWVTYPLLQEGFNDIHQETSSKLAREYLSRFTESAP